MRRIGRTVLLLAAGLFFLALLAVWANSASAQTFSFNLDQAGQARWYMDDRDDGMNQIPESANYLQVRGLLNSFWSEWRCGGASATRHVVFFNGRDHIEMRCRSQAAGQAINRWIEVKDHQQPESDWIIVTEIVSVGGGGVFDFQNQHFMSFVDSIGTIRVVVNGITIIDDFNEPGAFSYRHGQYENSAGSFGAVIQGDGSIQAPPGMGNWKFQRFEPPGPLPQLLWDLDTMEVKYEVERIDGAQVRVDGVLVHTSDWTALPDLFLQTFNTAPNAADWWWRGPSQYFVHFTLQLRETGETVTVGHDIFITEQAFPPVLVSPECLETQPVSPDPEEAQWFDWVIFYTESTVWYFGCSWQVVMWSIQWVGQQMQNAWNAGQAVSQLVQNAFAFLPPPVSALVAVGLAFGVLLRVFGR